jgi:hypothetical protein
MNTKNWQSLIDALENTRIIAIEYNSTTRKTKSAYIKRLAENSYLLVVDKNEVGVFGSEQSAYFYWKTEFDCKIAEKIESKPIKVSFWKKFFGKTS